MHYGKYKQEEKEWAYPNSDKYNKVVAKCENPQETTLSQ